MAGLRSVFKSPEGGVVGGLATAIAVLFIYNSALPSHADIRQGDSNNTDIEAARKGAAIKSSALVGLVFLLTRDLNTFILGGGTVAGIDYLAKHHNSYSPISGKLETGGPDTAMPSNVYSMPEYSASGA